MSIIFSIYFEKGIINMIRIVILSIFFLFYSISIFLDNVYFCSIINKSNK